MTHHNQGVGDWLYDHMGITTLATLTVVVGLCYWLVSVEVEMYAKQCHRLMAIAGTRADTMAAYATPIGYRGAACARYVGVVQP